MTPAALRQTQKDDTVSTVRNLAEILVKVDPENFRIAFNEDCKSKDLELQADSFLKFREQRLGRDFKVYGLMSLMSLQANTMTNVLEEIVLPLQRTSLKGYVAGLEFLLTLKCFGDLQDEWEKLITSFFPKEGSTVTIIPDTSSECSQNSTPPSSQP